MISVFLLEVEPNINIGTLTMYSLLFVFCLLAYYNRASKDINNSLHLTFIVSIFGIINSALFLATYNVYDFSSVRKLQCGSFFFGLTLATLTWMVGIFFLSTLVKDKKPVQLLVSYFITIVQFVLILVNVIYLAKVYTNADSFGYGIYDSIKVYSDVTISIISINWSYFLLFFSLIIQYRSSLHRSVMVTALIFGVFNTVMLITETANLRPTIQIGFKASLYILFFFTDFISSVSLYITLVFWKNIKETSQN